MDITTLHSKIDAQPVSREHLDPPSTDYRPILDDDFFPDTSF